jgi:hypothetical protein
LDDGQVAVLGTVAVGLLSLHAAQLHPRQAAVVLNQKRFEGLHRDCSVLLDVLKENGDVLFSGVRLDHENKLFEVIFGECGRCTGQDLIEAEIFGVYVHAEVAHDEVDLGGALLLEVAGPEVPPKQRVAEDLSPVQSLLLVQADAPVDEVAHVGANGHRLRDGHLSGEYLLAEAL